METVITTKPGQFVVEFLIKRTVLVEAFDEIQAEHEAVKKLSPSERLAADRVRILAGCYEDGTPYNPHDGWDTPMHNA